MNNYEREIGDDLLSNDPRLKYEWKWVRIAADEPEEVLKKWTHFQCSGCRFGKWKLEVTQWDGKNITYEASASYNGEPITSKEGFDTRLEAQIGAEKMLAEWIQEQYHQLINSK